MKPAWLLVLAACTPPDNAPPACAPPPVVAPPIATPVVIHFERGSCYGPCPSYSVDLSAAGVVTFQGPENVTRWRFVWWLPPERVAAIRELFIAARFFELDDHYLGGATDNPTVTTRATIDGRTKTVEHYYGRDDAPRELAMLEDAIDVLVGTKPWVDAYR